MIDPKGDPREHDDEDRRQIRLEYEIANVALEPEGQGQSLIGARGQLFHSVVGLVADDRKLWPGHFFHLVSFLDRYHQKTSTQWLNLKKKERYLR